MGGGRGLERLLQILLLPRMKLTRSTTASPDPHGWKYDTIYDGASVSFHFLETQTGFQ